jgi:glycerate kinase
VLSLEKILKKWSTFAKPQMKNLSGAGAAGALAFGLSGFAGAALVNGTPFIMKILRWNAAAKKADIILTGEGRLDPTSFSGKVIGEIVRRRGRARRGRARVFAVCGSTPLSPSAVKRRGLAAVQVMGRSGLIHPKLSLRQATTRLFARLI